jgi:predicted nucleotidyltransferase
MISQKQIDEIKRKVIPILRHYAVKKAAIFGSVMRGEATADSDIDILVEIRNDMSLLDFVGLKIEIEEALGKDVDLVEYSTIKPLIKERILSEQVVIL